MGRAIAAFIAAALIAPSLASAQPAGDKVDAQSLMQSGVKLLDAKDYLGALAVFRDAYSRFPRPKILLNIGTTLKLLGRDAEAANAYQRYLDSSEADPKRRPELTKLVDDIDKKVGRLEITVTPADAQIQVGDDEWITAAVAAKWRVTPGKLAIHVRRDGYQPETKAAQLAAGEQLAISIQLVEIPKPKPTIITVQGPTIVKQAPEGPRSRLGALALGHADIFNKGGAALVGVTIDVTDRIQVQGAGILGPYFGGYAGASVAVLPGQYRPFVAAGMPVFASNGARFGVRGAGGLEVLADRHLAIIIEVGVEHVFNPEMGKAKNMLVPALGVVGRL